jgi:hypothetical protein
MGFPAILDAKPLPRTGFAEDSVFYNDTPETEFAASCAAARQHADIVQRTAGVSVAASIGTKFIAVFPFRRHAFRLAEDDPTADCKKVLDLIWPVGPDNFARRA